MRASHMGVESLRIWKKIFIHKREEYINLYKSESMVVSLASSNSCAEWAFNLPSLMLSDRWPFMNHDILQDLMSINIIEKLWTPRERERESETDRDRDRETERDRDRDRERQRQRQRNLLIMLSKRLSQNEEQKRLSNLQQNPHESNQMSSSRVLLTVPTATLARALQIQKMFNKIFSLKQKCFFFIHQTPVSSRFLVKEQVW